jgi:hypothetical protein
MSLIFAERATAQEDHPTITERKMPVNTTEPTRTFDVGSGLVLAEQLLNPWTRL